MKINNDFCANKKIAFKNEKVFDNFTLPVTMKSSAQLKSSTSESVISKTPLTKDKFDKSPEQQISRNEIIALTLSLVAALITLGYGLSGIFKRA